MSNKERLMTNEEAISMLKKDKEQRGDCFISDAIDVGIDSLKKESKMLEEIANLYEYINKLLNQIIEQSALDKIIADIESQRKEAIKFAEFIQSIKDEYQNNKNVLNYGTLCDIVIRAWKIATLPSVDITNLQSVVPTLKTDSTDTAEDSIILEGKLQDLDNENRNHRIYGKVNIEQEIKIPDSDPINVPFTPEEIKDIKTLLM